MSKNRLLRYVLLCVLVGVLMSVFANLLFPVILGSRFLFWGLVVLLFVCGLATAVISVRERHRR